MAARSAAARRAQRRPRLKAIEFPPARRSRAVPVGTTGEAIPPKASSRGRSPRRAAKQIGTPTLRTPRCGGQGAVVTSGEATGRLLIVLRPGGFERFFLGVADRRLEPPADMGRIAELAARYGLEFLGPNPFGAG